MATMAKKRKNLLIGLAFLAPNLLGFMCLTFLPLVISLAMAFTNWDLTLHNIFKTNPIRFVGLENFYVLLSDQYFWQYFGNTLFLMIGIPFGIAGSLTLALLLGKNFKGPNNRVYLSLIVAAIVAAGMAIQLALGMGATAMMLMLITLAGVLLIGGAVGGSVVYRTLFYLPSFTAGTAVFVLWQKLYNPNTGPINTFLKEPLESLAKTVNALPVAVVQSLAWLLLILAAWILFGTLNRIRKSWKDGEVGRTAMVIPSIFMILPAFLGYLWIDGPGRFLLPAAAIVILIWQAIRMKGGPDFRCLPGDGFGGAAMMGLLSLTGQLIFVGLGMTVFSLPVMASDGLIAPNWLGDIHWAKPALMIMGFWLGVGSNNMLLYLAGLSNIPPELYEAADIDGAKPLQRFWNITWPQLAPTTFFIVVMSVIGGLQGGFEQARVMTAGGPDGATTTLSYYIYKEGFEIGQLGFASAAAWALFIFMFSVTLFNWRFGNRYVND